MEWNQVLEHPHLRDIPFKIELNEWGKIVMSPASNLHGNLQVRIAMKIMRLMDTGEASAEVSILTSKNVKLADLAWASENFIRQHGFETPYLVAPEICVEIISLGNTSAEMAEKRNFILPRGRGRSGYAQKMARWNFLPMKVKSRSRKYARNFLPIFEADRILLEGT